MRLELEALRRVCRHLIGLGDVVADVVKATDALRHENNMLRRQTKRLLAEIRDAKMDAGRAKAANRDAQTMAQHWRLKAEGGNYDEMKEDGP